MKYSNIVMIFGIVIVAVSAVASIMFDLYFPGLNIFQNFTSAKKRDMFRLLILALPWIVTLTKSFIVLCLYLRIKQHE